MGGEGRVGGDARGGIIRGTVGACMGVDSPVEAEAMAGQVDCC